MRTAVLLGLAAAPVMAQVRDQVHVINRDATNSLHVFDASPSGGGPPARIAVTTLPAETWQLHVDRQGFLWALDYGMSRVHKLIAPPNGGGTNLVFTADFGPQATNGVDLAFDGNGDAWIACVAPVGTPDYLVRIDRNTGVIAERVNAQIENIRCITILRSGSIIVGTYHDSNNAINLSRLDRVGPQWFGGLIYSRTPSFSSSYYDLIEDPSGAIWTICWCDGAPDIVLMDQNGIVLKSIDLGGQLGLSSRITGPYSAALIGSQLWVSYWGGNDTTGIACWDVAASPVFVRNISHSLVGTQRDAPGLAVDGLGRVWCLQANGRTWHTNSGRDSIDSILHTTGAVDLNHNLGDASGFIRASTIDAYHDDDGDGAMNIMEIEAGRNPFDPLSHPDHRSYLHVNSPVALGDAATWSLFAPAQDIYFLLAAQRSLTPGIPIMGIQGFLRLDLSSPFYFLVPASGAPFLTVPSTGFVSWTTGVPLDPALRGSMATQALSGSLAGSFGWSNLSTLQIQ